MSENVIFFINYLLYSLNNLALIIASTYLLTPKYSRIKVVIIWVIVESIGGTLKFFTPLYSNEDMIWGYINTITYLCCAYIMCKEGIIACIITFGSLDMINVLSSIIWMMSPYTDSTNWEIGTTIAYLICLPVSILGFFLIIWEKKILIDKSYNYMSKSMALLLFIVVLYYTIYTYLPMKFIGSMNMIMRCCLISLEFGGLLIYTVIMYMIFKKGEAQAHLKHYELLQLKRNIEEDSYEQLLKRIDTMEKIRHDFYGQLSTARYIISQDSEKGMKMIEELGIQIDNMDKEIEG